MEKPQAVRAEIFKTKACLKIYVLFLICAFIFFKSHAQNGFQVSGEVRDDKGLPLNSASVSLKGSSNGTTTDANGAYKITLTGPGTLVFSYAGFSLKEIAVTAAQTLNVTLNPEDKALTDVIVTGYSRQSKRDITGAVSTVSAEVIAKTPVSDIGQVLQGRVAGISVDDQGGPGSTAVVRIRGFGTLGNNDPLYVIDGVQIRGSNNLINTNDIETINILKDPSLTSLYGAQGSNGVIVITTKSGKVGAPKLEFSSYAGTQRAIKYPSMLTPQQYADAYWNYKRNSGEPLTDLYYGSGENAVLPDYIIETPSGAPVIIRPGNPQPDFSLYDLYSYRILKTNKAGTDWFNEIFQPGFTQNYQLTLSGATDKSSYAITFNYYDDKGVILKTKFKRYSIRTNTDIKIKPWLRVGENIEFSYSETSGIPNHSNNNVVTDLYTRSPLIPVYDVAGNYSGPKGLPVGVLSLKAGGNNPVLGQIKGAENSSGFNSGIIGSAFIDVEPIKGLIAESKIGLQLYPYQYHYFQDTFPQNIYSGAYNSFSEGGGYTLDWRWTNKLSYDVNINNVHKLSAFVAYEARRFTARYNGATTPNLPYTLLSYRYLTSGVPIDSISLINLVTGGGDIQTNVSVFGNLNYSLLDRYLFSFVLRRDGSSRFGQFNRYGTFPSVSAGWRVTGEKFMNNVSWLNELKLRASYGSNGNDAIPSVIVNQYSSNTYTSSYDLGGNNNSASTGFGLYQIGNPYLKWEVNKTTNIGFDAALFKSRFIINFNWFNRITNDLLYVPPFTGLQGDALAPYQNVLKFANKGFELELGYTSGRHVVSYDMNFNISTYRNKVLYISDDPTAFISGDGYGSTHVILNRSVVGRPVASFYGYIQEGIFQSTKEVEEHATETGIDKSNPETGLGHFKFKDINNDGVINEQDRTFIGSPHPKFTYGYNLNLYYKNFDLNVFLQGSAGNKIFNYWRAYTRWPGALGAGSNDTWSEANTDASLPVWESSGANDAAASTFFIENGSYMRIKSIQLGYTFPKPKGFSKLRIYAQAFNIATFTKYTGIDPEITTGRAGNYGVDLGGNYPIAFKLLFGFNIGL